MGCGKASKVNEIKPKRNTVLLCPGQFVRKLETNIHTLYELKEQLGSGSYGRVVSAISKVTGERRAVKIINKKSIKNEQTRKKILNEVEIQKQLDHPNIVKIFEFYEDDRNLYIIMEECSGGELLASIYKQKGISETLTACFMKQIFSALVYMHSLGVVHRDLKLENMLLERPNLNTLKIADFGIATVLKPGGKLDTTIGTITYIAPEVIKHKYDSQCDLWSAGVIMYILITGEPPFKSESKNKTIKKILRGKVKYDQEIWQLVSNYGKNIVEGLLDPNPSTRLNSTQALNSNWMLNTEASYVKQSLIQQSANNLKKFFVKNKFQKAVIRFITSHLLRNQDKHELIEVFKKVNRSGSGKVTEDEIVEFCKSYGNEDFDELVAKELFCRVDTDNNGVIEYTEFLAAAIDKRKLICLNNLKAAFSTINVKGNGKLTVDELKAFLKSDEEIETNAYERLIELVDKNGDGVIDFEEFKEIMEDI